MKTIPLSDQLTISVDEIYKGKVMLGPEAVPCNNIRLQITSNNVPILERQWVCKFGKIWIGVPYV